MGGQFLYHCGCNLSRFWLKLFYRYKVIGPHYCLLRGAIIASNHCSFIDPLAIGAAWPDPVHFLARSTLFKPAWWGRLLLAVNARPIEREGSDLGAFRTACQLIEKGARVIIFPEGTRSRSQEMGEIKAGAALIATKTRCPIVPIYLHGFHEIWGRQRKLPRFRGRAICVVGSPIEWHEFAHLDRKEAQKAITQRLTNALKALQDWYRQGAVGLPP